MNIESTNVDSVKNDKNNNHKFICGVVEGFYGKPWTHDQRKDLFKRLKTFKMNSFMYAPKDDTKHRAKWRQMYSESEAEELKVLIDDAKANGIDFYYSLAPGLDLIYSEQSDLEVLRRKYDQIVSLGCESFAILFDDIEPSISNERDRRIFKSIASAQVSVTNMIYNHLNRPKFLFCPTEYCESRALPNVVDSIYLNTLGTDLCEGIDILWSGPRVVSRLISEESIDTLTKVIRRPPLIWENLHANDYDKRRMYLGPYSGRSTKIIPKLRGVLTNPNCEYEANFIAIHTLAQWSKCTEDVNQHNICNLKEKCLRDYGRQPGSICERQSEQEIISDYVYDPNRALVQAIRDWLPRVLESKSMPSDITLSTQAIRRNDVSASNQLFGQVNDHSVSKNMGSQEEREAEVHSEERVIDVEENSVDMLPDETHSSVRYICTSKSDMDTSGSMTPANLVDANSCDSCDMQVAIEQPPDNLDAKGNHNSVFESNLNGQSPGEQEQKQRRQQKDLACVDCVMHSEEKSEKCDVLGRAGDGVCLTLEAPVNRDHLSLLVDLFYLPFQHGLHGYALLEDIEWLRTNHDVLVGLSNSNVEDQAGWHKVEHEEGRVRERENAQVCNEKAKEVKSMSAWVQRAEKLNNLSLSISSLVNNLIYNCPNKLLIMELYPYLADLRDVSSMIIDYIKFLRFQGSSEREGSHGYSKTWARIEEPCNGTGGALDEQEPWIHPGGLIGDVHRLLS